MPDDEQDEQPDDEQGEDETPAPIEDLKLWQVVFESGHGQQIYANSEDEARAEMERIYGSEYPVASVKDITPQPVK